MKKSMLVFGYAILFSEHYGGNPMSGSSKKTTDKRFSYADYLKWNNDERWEIIDGLAYSMSPAPLPLHQQILAQLVTELSLYFRNKKCVVYPAPFDVRLTKAKKRNDQIFDVVQPDISVVCDENKIDDKGCLGSPDLVIEILSPSTASRDHILKRALYETNGVKEYWLVDPVHRIVTVYQLTENNKFGPVQYYDDQCKIDVSIFAELQIDLAQVFPPLPVIICENPPPGYHPKC